MKKALPNYHPTLNVYWGQLLQVSADIHESSGSIPAGFLAVERQKNKLFGGQAHIVIR